MSNNYVKKYDVGQIKLDLPYANYIHELPLLSFGDVQHAINLSLIFNRERKTASDNSFSITEGFKLNLQKRLDFDQCANKPIALFDANGKRITLYHNEGDVYTFGDDSQRILRKISNTYEVEYPDFSKETYNQNGYITATFDKYSANALLTFSYTVGDRLSSINYGGNKVISFTYEANRLASVSYADCNIGFTYNSDTYKTLNSITHYSGVSYTFDYSNGFIVRAKDGDTSSTIVDSLSVTVDGTSNKVTVSNYYGDSTVYEFSTSISPTSNDNVVTITDNNGVKTREQYQYGKLLYSYEVGSGAEFVDNAFSGNVRIYDTMDNLDGVGAVGVQTRYDGIHMYPTGEGSTILQMGATNYSNVKGYYLLTGWAKSSDGENQICISNHPNGSEIDIYPNVSPNNEWHYFAYKFYMDANVIYVYPHVPALLELKDVRITYQSTHIWDQKFNTHVAISDDVLVHYNENGCTYIPLSSATISGGGLNLGNDDKICFDDILKYKINQKKQLHTNEFYANKVKKIIPILTPSNIIVSYDGATYNLNDCYLAKRQYVKENQFILSLVNDHPSDNLNSFIMLKTLDSNQCIMSTKKFDNNLDVIESTEDVIAIAYERNAQGLITKETASGLYRHDTTYADNLITVKDIDIDTQAIKSTTKYHINTVFGGIEKIEFYEGTNTLKSTITNTFDGDMSVLTGKSFGSRANSLSYAAGNLEMLATGDLRYQMGYNNGDMTEMSKYNASTNSFNTIEAHTHSENEGETTVVSKYPSSVSPSHTESVTFDKYGRLKEIDGILINSYDIWPTFTDVGGMVNNSDNGSALLGMTTDLLRNEATRYKYNGKCQLVKKTVTDNDDFFDKISEETFEYDDIGRLTKDHFNYNQSANSSVTSVVEYEKEANDPAANNRINKYCYYLNGATTPTSQTQNVFDEFKRVKDKKFTINSGEFKRNFEFTGTRVRSILETFDYDTPRPLTSSRYLYDSMGRIVYTSANGCTTTYTYDTYGQLIREDNQALDKTFKYEYNGIGNIMYVYEYPYTPAGTEPSATPIKTAYNYNSAKPDVLRKIGSEAVSFNANGGLSYYKRTYNWKNGKLRSFFRGSTMVPMSVYEECGYQYNAYGQRVSKTYRYDPNTSISDDASFNYTKTYQYDHSGRLINEKIVEAHILDVTSTREFVYLYDESGVIGCTYSVNGATPQTYYYQRNLLGDVIGIYNTSGNKVVEYAYDAWGNCTIVYSSNDSLANDNPIRYRGYYLDIENNFYYLNSRYYSPELRRFISPDDTSYLDPESVNGLNLYCYCNNDPVDNIFASEQINFLSTNQGSPIGNILKESESIHYNKSLPKLSWLASNSTSVYGVLSALNAGVPIATHYFKYASIINDEFRLYGISKFRTSLQLSNINLKITGLDGALIGVNVALDMYDSIQRGTSAEGVLLGGALTAASGVGIFYLNKGIMWSFTTLGTAICPGLGTGIGFASGLVLSILVDILLGEKLNRWIDEIAV